MVGVRGYEWHVLSESGLNGLVVIIFFSLANGWLQRCSIGSCARCFQAPNADAGARRRRG
jgi:hypothetical protein